MRKIIIKNFRCYDNKSIEFRSGVNLLIGDNASGKTSLLRACNLVINSFFSGYSDENTSWKSAENSDFRITGVTEQPVEIAFSLGEWDLLPLSIPEADMRVFFDPDDVLKIEKKNQEEFAQSCNRTDGVEKLCFSSPKIFSCFSGWRNQAELFLAGLCLFLNRRYP